MQNFLAFPPSPFPFLNLHSYHWLNWFPESNDEIIECSGARNPEKILLRCQLVEQDFAALPSFFFRFVWPSSKSRVIHLILDIFIAQEINISCNVYTFLRTMSRGCVKARSPGTIICPRSSHFTGNEPTGEKRERGIKSI